MSRKQCLLLTHFSWPSLGICGVQGSASPPTNLTHFFNGAASYRGDFVKKFLEVNFEEEETMLAKNFNGKKRMRNIPDHALINNVTLAGTKKKKKQDHGFIFFTEVTRSPIQLKTYDRFQLLKPH